jgi:N-methylhydantoinase B/oxoprolinase/acetone carboxylase alpha subunit
VFWQGELVCWVSATIHEGENGACEPGGMPAAAERKYDEGLKMSPFKAVENFKIKRDLLTFLQKSVRDPKLQTEYMKLKLHASMRLRERVLTILNQYGRDALAATLRKNLEDTEIEVRRRIKELPDGTTRVQTFMDSTLRENAIQKLGMAVTVKGDEMTFDFRGGSPQFLNRAVNTNMASFKAALVTGLLQNVWPDLPPTMGILSPIKILSDPGSLISATRDSPQAMSLMLFFKASVLPKTVMAKLSYGLPKRYTAIIAPPYDQAATFDFLPLMNNQSLPGTYSVNGTGMTFELFNEGELYMNRQGAGGGCGDVLERDPELVMKDIAEDLMSAAVAQSVYHVVFDEATLTLDRAATDAARAAERKARIARGKPFDEFCAAWVTPEPPEHIPYFGSWDDPAEIYAGVPGARIKTSALQQTGVMMPDPKDVRIAALEAEVAALRAAA